MFGAADEKLDPLGSGQEARMFDREDVELALEALAQGWSAREAGELVGAGRETVKRWASGRVPHARAAPRRRIGGGRTRREEGPRTSPRGRPTRPR